MNKPSDKNNHTESFNNYEFRKSRRMWGNFAAVTKYSIIAICIIVFIVVALIV